MVHIAVVGSGVVGAAIAYELSLLPGLHLTLLDRHAPAQAATGAALGVLMGIISQKIRGNAWELRQLSMQRYETLISELEAIAGTPIPFNRQGILKLVFDPQEWQPWATLAATRRSQGWQLELWDVDQVSAKAPQLNLEGVAFAVYSPQDRQVDPTALTHALVTAVQRRGMTCQFETTLEKLVCVTKANLQVCQHLQTSAGALPVDGVVLAAGLGSPPLLADLLTPPITIHPVLGQAVRVKLPVPLGNALFQPAITGNDIHIVPLGQGEYWVGATVEFPQATGAVVADVEQLDRLLEGAIALCPALKQAVLLQQWSGLRPRPHNRPAPIIEAVPGYSNVWLATGHYRNGVLLAPATALRVKAFVESWLTSR